MRLIAWNIRAGGGQRAAEIAAQLLKWRADVAVLSEFRATPPSQTIAAHLGRHGLSHQRIAVGCEHTRTNRVFIASRYPLRRRHIPGTPTEPGRWLSVAVAAPHPLILAAMHIPNQATGRKGDFHSGVANTARRLRSAQAILIGDTNSGRIGIDEETSVFTPATHAWFDDLAQQGFVDAFRERHPRKRAYTWYSPSYASSGGNGFRLDQAFVSRATASRVARVEHRWGVAEANPERRDALSDHAAVVLDLDTTGT